MRLGARYGGSDEGAGPHDPDRFLEPEHREADARRPPALDDPGRGAGAHLPPARLPRRGREPHRRLGLAVRRAGRRVAALAREVDLDREPVRGLLELYQRGKKAIEQDPQFAAEARTAWQELESGQDGDVRATWRWATEASLRGFDRTYARLGITHDLVRGESFYEPFLEDAIQRCSAAEVAEMSQGALVVQLGGGSRSRWRRRPASCARATAPPCTPRATWRRSSTASRSSSSSARCTSSAASRSCTSASSRPC
jgi:hypothetical protein